MLISSLTLCESIVNELELRHSSDTLALCERIVDAIEGAAQCREFALHRALFSAARNVRKAV